MSGTDDSLHTILNVLDTHDDLERQDILESVRQLFCMFCGSRHPVGGMCCCYDGIPPLDRTGPHG